jgi:hypothetical protein
MWRFDFVRVGMLALLAPQALKTACAWADYRKDAKT